jgi:hypothetical protein
MQPRTKIPTPTQTDSEFKNFDNFMRVLITKLPKKKAKATPTAPVQSQPLRRTRPRP